MKKVFVTVMIVLGISLVLMGISLWLNPAWMNIKGWWFILLGIVFVGVAEIGGKLKDWSGFLFGETDKKPNKKDDKPNFANVNFTGNVIKGKNKLKVGRDNVNVSNNQISGENDVSINSENTKDSRSRSSKK